MDRKRKQNLLVAVLFLLAFLLLIGVLLLQICSTKLKTEIEIRKEIRAVEEKIAGETSSESNTTSTQTCFALANREEEKAGDLSDARLQKNNYKNKENQSLQDATPKTTRSKSPQPTAEKSTSPAIKTTTTQAICTETIPTEAETEPQLPPVLSVNFKTKKIHGPNCPVLKQTNPENIREILREQVEDYLWEGYKFCSKCKGYAQ